MSNQNNALFSTKNMAKIAILGAISFVLMLIEFPLPFIAPPYYKLDFSELAVLIGGFALGPMAAVCIEALKILLNLLFTGTQTMFVGEFANFIIGISFALPASILYQRNKTQKTAIQGMAIGTVCMALTGLILNYFVLLPAYGYFFHMAIEDIVKAGQMIFPFITNKFLFVLCCVVPFNLIKGVLISVVTALLYKHVSKLLHA